jgi:hypothetical protein
MSRSQQNISSSARHSYDIVGSQQNLSSNARHRYAIQRAYILVTCLENIGCFANTRQMNTQQRAQMVCEYCKRLKVHEKSFAHEMA